MTAFPHRSRALLRPLALAAALAVSPACRTEAPSSGAAAAPKTAAIAPNGPMGNYAGTLKKHDGAVADHRVDVLTDRAGAPTVTVYEFCSLPLTGPGPSYTVAEGASCLLDLGDGKQRPRAATGEATIADGRINVTVTFPDDRLTWSYEGRR